ncbi:MAG: hypothetical protein PVJ33_12285 [Lysobacterales bacterium]|jgi:hypothetical protein
MGNALRKAPPSLAAPFRRLGIGGFVFFFAKGLLWLAVPWVAHLMAG